MALWDHDSVKFHLKCFLNLKTLQVFILRVHAQLFPKCTLILKQYYPWTFIIKRHITKSCSNMYKNEVIKMSLGMFHLPQNNK